ncbi:MAG TPA: hypothetical protein VFI91_06090 [Longimicrobiaceae bacterium]|nr:hypothetical protein [Longimicrobiaceae bacterium]
MNKVIAILVMVGLIAGTAASLHCSENAGAVPVAQQSEHSAHHGPADDGNQSPDRDHKQNASCELAMGCAMAAAVASGSARSTEPTSNPAVLPLISAAHSPPSLAADPPPPRLHG